MASKRVATVASRQLRLCPSIPVLSVRPQPPPRPRTSPNTTHRHPTFSIRPLSTSSRLRKEAPAQSSPEIPPATIYTFADVQSLSSTLTATPDPKRILIDVREPAELLASGTIPSSVNVPVSSAPDAFFLPPEEFEDKYGFERPGGDTEVVFFCKAGVRSRQAARLAGQAGFGGKVGEFPGSWLEWVEKGGKVERVQ